MGDLSANFSLHEFTRSGTAQRYRLDNIPDDLQRAAIAELANNPCQWLRDQLGRIDVTGGFVTPEVNALIAGRTQGGQHERGEAADLLPRYVDRWYAWGVLVAGVLHGLMPIDQAIVYDDKPHIHVSYIARGGRRPNRTQLLYLPSGSRDYLPWQPWA